jgi:3'-phosphoadenosine 5'-phosphosulfate sulfotransferase (PAPS reductase)/FAD synthetase
LRRQQSPTRRDLPFSEWDGENGLQKYNPLPNTTDDVWSYVRPRGARARRQGYASIGRAMHTGHHGRRRYPRGDGGKPETRMRTYPEASIHGSVP